MPSREKTVKLIQTRPLVLLLGIHLASDRQRSRTTLASVVKGVIDRAFTDRDASPPIDRDLRAISRADRDVWSRFDFTVMRVRAARTERPRAENLEKTSLAGHVAQIKFDKRGSSVRHFQTRLQFVLVLRRGRASFPSTDVPAAISSHHEANLALDVGTCALSIPMAIRKRESPPT